MPTLNQTTTSRRFEATLVASFCFIFVCLALAFMQSASPTFDENVYLPAGYTYLKWQDYRIDSEHPPLVKKLAALPLLLQNVWPPEVEPREEDFSNDEFVSSERLLHLSWAIALKYPNSQWNFCHQVMYGVTEEAQRRVKAVTSILLPTDGSVARADFHNPVERLILSGRLLLLLLGTALAVLVYLWSRQLWGLWSTGALSLALFVFDPNFIPHSSLIGTDVPLALFMSGAVYFYWRLCRRLDWTSGALFLLCFAFAFVTKFSAVLLLPIFWLIAIGRLLNREPWPLRPASRETQSLGGRALTLLGLFAAACLVTWVTIWAFYSFRFSAAKDIPKAIAQEERAEKIMPSLGRVEFQEPGHLPVEDDVRYAEAVKVLLKTSPDGNIPPAAVRASLGSVSLGPVSHAILFTNRHQLLPEAYLAGLARTRVIALQHPSFLRGAFSGAGFRTYFIWTFLLKTPLLTLAIILASLGLAVARKVPWQTDLAFLIIPVAVYFGSALATNLDIGHRHLLPLYPFLYVLGGLVAKEIAALRRPVWQTRCAAALVIGLGLSSSFVLAPPWRPQIVYPHYLSYFNELAGGPLNGWASLVDSNIDWGQDLGGLKEWLNEHSPANPIYLCYFGTTDPRYYQIPHRAVTRFLGGYQPTSHQANPEAAAQRFYNALKPGDLVAVSVQSLIGPSLSPAAHELWQKTLARCTFVDRIGYSIFILKVLDAAQ